jgi:DNA-binding GntR family transcriptional regulator
MPAGVPTGHTEKAYQFIREKILTGEFPPGRPLVVQELSDLTKVSRTPIRDALRQLEGEGLVVIQPNMGAAVRSISREEFRELCCLRLAVESYAAREAARLRQESDLREMERHFSAMEEYSRKMVRPREFKFNAQLEARHDIYFHLAVVEATRNRSLKKEVIRLCLMYRFVPGDPLPQGWDPETRSTRRFAEHLEDVLKQHAAILDAIRAQDSEAARLAMEQHIQDKIDQFDQAGVRIREEHLSAALKI